MIYRRGCVTCLTHEKCFATKINLLSSESMETSCSVRKLPSISSSCYCYCLSFHGVRYIIKFIFNLFLTFYFLFTFLCRGSFLKIIVQKARTLRFTSLAMCLSIMLLVYIYKYTQIVFNVEYKF